MRETLLRQGVSSMRMLPVKRNYAFENPDVPHGEQYILKVGVGGSTVHMGGGSTVSLHTACLSACPPACQFRSAAPA